MLAFAADVTASMHFIVRFEGGTSRQQAEEYIQNAGGKDVKVLSVERNTYQARADSIAACRKAVELLGKASQVVFAEREESYSVQPQ